MKTTKTIDSSWTEHSFRTPFWRQQQPVELILKDEKLVKLAYPPAGFGLYNATAKMWRLVKS